MKVENFKQTAFYLIKIQANIERLTDAIQNIMVLVKNSSDIKNIEFYEQQGKTPCSLATIDFHDEFEVSEREIKELDKVKFARYILGGKQVKKGKGYVTKTKAIQIHIK